MTFLLDTCVLSDASKVRGDANVAEWLSQVPEESKYVSVVSLSEIRFGILLSPAGQRRESLKTWYEDILRPSVEGRVLSLDETVALKWAEIRAVIRSAPVIDAQIAATALVHGLTLVTRNVKDFAFPGLAVFNPWSK